MPDRVLETELGGTVCGIDECGRGALAGAVVACAVVVPFPTPSGFEAVRDSKLVPKSRHAALARMVVETCRVGIGRAEVSDVDRLNVLRATFLAMTRAVTALGAVPDHALVDGHLVPPSLPCGATAVVGGDGLCLAVAAASLVAKAHRDAEMTGLHLLHPGYGWDRNAGYGTPAHFSALRELGPTALHRRTFGGVRGLCVPCPDLFGAIDRASSAPPRTS